MTPSTIALAAVFALVGMSVAAADMPRGDPSNYVQQEARRDPPRWVPGWLADALRNAIADATDMRERHKSNDD